jgi:tRNA (guanine26-N2/guanine27-N2)-dimethyltransferase
MDLIEIREGTTTFFIPPQDDTTQFPPGTAPIFFNRRMEINRDVTILLLSILKPSDYLDAMGASGIRGLRVVQECSIPVTINDRDPAATDLIIYNAHRADLPVEVVQRDASSLLSERSFDAVDLDPFGTPAFVIDAAVRGTRRYLFVTATDTAPLCGAHLKAGIRRYNARPMNTEYHGEVGLRILLGFVVRQTVKYDRGVEPVFCFSREHFARLHLRLIRGAKAADETLSHTGFIHQCPACPYREEQPGLLPVTSACPYCGTALQPIGPLWLGSICNKEIVQKMKEDLDNRELGTRKDLAKILDLCLTELPTSSHYNYHQIAKLLGCSPPNIDTVINRIIEQGFPTTRTHFSGYGIKTEAPLDIIKAAIKGSTL